MGKLTDRNTIKEYEQEISDEESLYPQVRRYFEKEREEDKLSGKEATVGACEEDYEYDKNTDGEAFEKDNCNLHEDLDGNSNLHDDLDGDDFDGEAYAEHNDDDNLDGDQWAKSNISITDEDSDNSTDPMFRYQILIAKTLAFPVMTALGPLT